MIKRDALSLPLKLQVPDKQFMQAPTKHYESRAKIISSPHTTKFSPHTLESSLLSRPSFPSLPFPVHIFWHNHTKNNCFPFVYH